jgi:hypothetical protein
MSSKFCDGEIFVWGNFSYNNSIHDTLLFLIYNREEYSTSLTLSSTALNVLLHFRNT